MDEGNINSNFYFNLRVPNRAPHNWVGSSAIEPKTGNLSLEINLAPKDSVFLINCAPSGKLACFNASIVRKRGRGSFIINLIDKITA